MLTCETQPDAPKELLRMLHLKRATKNVAPEVAADDCPGFPVAGTARNCKFTQAAVQKETKF